MTRMYKFEAVERVKSSVGHDVDVLHWVLAVLQKKSLTCLEINEIKILFCVQVRCTPPGA
jgi:hypothetical protein